MKRLFRKIVVLFSTIALIMFNNSFVYAANTVQSIGVVYQANVEGIGWQQQVHDNEDAGTIGKGLRIEAFKASLSGAPQGMRIKYQAHVQNIGWQNWVYDGQLSGTQGQALRIEAVKVELEGAPAGYHIEYQAHVQNIGWQDWVSDGDIAGTINRGLRIESLRMRVVKYNGSTDTNVGVSYQANVENIGWQKSVQAGDIAGTTGKGYKVEGLKIQLNNSLPNMQIRYQAHVQNIGWQNWSYDGQLAGTDGQGLRMEALKIELVGAPQGYHIEYQSHVQGIGWQDWVRDGNISGTSGKGLRIEALRVRIVTDVSMRYQASVEGTGWQNSVQDGSTIGTTGKGLRIEGIKISLENQIPDMKVKYQAHIQNIGWDQWVYDGAVAGRPGQGLRIEAIKIMLEGVPEGYHIQYQAHVQGIGWQDWVQDGNVAGTTGLGLRIEALKVRIVKDFGNYVKYDKPLDQAVDVQYNLPANNGKAVYEVYDDATKTSKWLPAEKNQIEYYMNPLNFLDQLGRYQFLNLNYTGGITVEDINSMLVGKGVLEGKGAAFLEASKNYNISPIYLVSHALLESGNGTSTLSRGIEVKQLNKLKIVTDSTGKKITVPDNPVDVTPMTVYNLFGIHAYDLNPNVFGSEFAYRQGWTSVEAAIIGGAQFISTDYVNNSSYKQNTLYKMRWNPANTGTHQYATDISWADNQVRNIKTLIDKCKAAIFTFEIPFFN